MAEELQNLLEKIQKDGVEKADNESQKIISEAKGKAESIIEDAETKAKDILAKAEKDGQAFEQRAKKSIEQSGRDTVLSVTEAINDTIKRIAGADIGTAFSSDALAEVIADIIKAYCKEAGGPASIELLLGAERQNDIKDMLTSRLKEEMQNGLEIKADDSIVAGFKVSVVNDNIQHDFTSEAITDALCSLLRPHLAEIIKGSSDS